MARSRRQSRFFRTSVALALAVVAGASGASSAQGVVAVGWHLTTPPADRVVALAGTSSTDLWAAGADGVVSRWDGSAWAAHPIAGNGTLRGIDALTASDVWAVGNSGEAQTLAEHWNGSAWTRLATPNPSDSQNVLRGVGANTPSDVWAVGDAYDGTAGGIVPLIEHWNGGAWTVAPSPVRGGELRAVTALSATNTWAVGYEDAGGGGIQPLIEHWNGTAWTEVAGPTPHDGDLHGLVALSASNIWAVGSTGNYALVEHWNGSAWSVIETPTPPDYPAILEGVAATGPSDVWAVGRITRSYSFGDETLIEHWTGSAWSVVKSPNMPGGGAVNELNSVAAFAPGDAWAAASDASSTTMLKLGQADFTSTLTVGADPAEIDRLFSAGGTLGLSEHASPAGSIIHVTRTAPDGSVETLHDAVVQPDGEYFFNVTYNLRGTYRYVATYDGEGAYPSATATTSVEVRGAEPLLTVRASDTAVPYKKEVTIRAHFVGAGSNHTISIWKKPAGGTASIVTTGAVNTDGNLATQVAPTRRTSYWATFAGDERTEPGESDSTVVRVGAKVTGALGGGYANRDGFRLYHYTSRCPSSGHGCPRYAIAVRPNHAGQCAYLTIQLRSPRGWVSVLGPRCFRLGSRSRVTVRLVYGNRSVIGYKARVRGEFRGDAISLSGRSAWSYFRVTQ